MVNDWEKAKLNTNIPSNNKKSIRQRWAKNFGGKVSRDLSKNGQIHRIISKNFT